MSLHFQNQRSEVTHYSSRNEGYEAKGIHRSQVMDNLDAKLNLTFTLKAVRIIEGLEASNAITQFALEKLHHCSAEDK